EGALHLLRSERRRDDVPAEELEARRRRGGRSRLALPPVDLPVRRQHPRARHLREPHSLLGGERGERPRHPEVLRGEVEPQTDTGGSARPRKRRRHPGGHRELLGRLASADEEGRHRRAERRDPALAKESGVVALWNLIFGFPHERVESYAENV